MEESSLATAGQNGIDSLQRLQAEMPPALARKEEELYAIISGLRMSPLKKLIYLYDFIDELYGFAAKYTPCRKGCSHCCHYRVSISSLEADYIEKKAGVKSRKKQPFSILKSYHGAPCPFLENGSCSIYDARPYPCRTLVSMCGTAHWCHPQKSNGAALKILVFSEVVRSYEHVVNISGSPIFDIREIF